MLYRLGLFMGSPHELVGPTALNRRGIFELLPLIELFAVISADAGYPPDFRRPPTLKEGWHEDYKGIAGQIAGSIECAKDPRLAITRDLWRDLYPDAIWVWCYREAETIATSWQGAYFMNKESVVRGVSAYLATYDDLDPQVTLPFDSVLEDPLGAAEALAESLGLDPSEEKLRLAASAVDPSLSVHTVRSLA